MPRDLILGCGFLGTRLAERLLTPANSSEESEVHTITRSDSKAVDLRRMGLSVEVCDLATPQAMQKLSANVPFRSITICVANDSAEQTHSQVYQAATSLAIDLASRTAPDNANPSSTRIHFVSTTGVYADSAESRDTAVDESWPTDPKRPGAIASLACEERLRSEWTHAHCVFRLAGIYAKSRIPNLANLQTGQPLTGSGEGWLNLIHVQDAAEILALSIQKTPPSILFNVSDGNPIRRRDFYQQIAVHLGCSQPVFDRSLGGRGGSKRIDNRRLQRWLNFPFRQVSDATVWL